jgi:hypothetical protein
MHAKFRIDSTTVPFHGNHQYDIIGCKVLFSSFSVFMLLQGFAKEERSRKLLTKSPQQRAGCQLVTLVF